MTWTMIDTWIVLTGLVTACSCALVGNFLVVRRMSLMGDAISHAVLPGLAAAFLIAGTRHPLPMFAGAVVAGLGTAYLTEWIHRHGKVEENSAMGVVFTSLFAAGLLLVVRAADTVDLDPSCVLYGALELAPLDVVAVGPWQWPRAFAIGLVVLAVNVLVIGLLYKELKITAFDPEHATALGIPARAIYYVLMTLVAVTTVASFESVGSILVIAMLIVPPAAGQFASGRLSRVMAWSLVAAAVSAVGGHAAAIGIPAWAGWPDTSTSGAMAVVSGAVFTGCFLFAPHKGVLARWWVHRSLRERIRREDVLGVMYRGHEERPGHGMDEAELLARTGQHAGTLRRALHQLRRLTWLERTTVGRWKLTGDGIGRAQDLVRDHRLWETYLHQTVHLPADHVHDTSEKLEHVTDSGIRRELMRATGGPSADPHGKQIPPAGDEHVGK